MIRALSRGETFALGCTAAAALAGFSVIVLFHPSAAELDASIHRAIDPYRTPGFLMFFGFVTAFGNSLWANAASALFVCYFSLTGRWRWSFCTIVFVQGGMTANRMLKLLFARPRPEGAGEALGHSFPSGHTMTAAALLGFVALYSWRASESRYGRLLAVAISVFLVTMVGISRVALGAHHSTDVVASILEAVAWTALCTLALDTAFGKEALTREARQGAAD